MLTTRTPRGTCSPISNGLGSDKHPTFILSCCFIKPLGEDSTPATVKPLRVALVEPVACQSQSTDARDETRALSATRARQLVGLPTGDSILDNRDRAISKFFLYSGARLSTACRLEVSDFHQDGDEVTIKLYEKGDKRRTISLHFQAAQAIAEYIEKAGLTSGPLFRPQLNPPSKKLGAGAMDPATLYRLIEGYLRQLPGALVETTAPDGTKVKSNVYTPHSLRATTAHPAPRCRCGYHQGQGTPRAPPHRNDPDLR